MKSLTFLALSSSLALADIEIYPTLHFNGIIGDTSADSFGDIGGHGHDPNNEVALQGLDVGYNLRVDDWLSGFVNVIVFTDEDRELDVELEEAFGKLSSIPGGFEIRGGRFLNRIGLQNSIHLHGWDFVNANLSTSQFLGEEGLFTDGVELTWQRDFDRSFLALTAAYGNVPEHEEEEEEGEEEESAENALFSDEVVTVRALFGYNHSDFHQHRLGLNGAWGDNGFGRDTQLHSIDYTYTWRENGLNPGGRSFTVGAEFFNRDVEFVHPDNSDNRGSISQNGYMIFTNYRFAEDWIAGLRYEHIQGRSGGAEIVGGDTEFAFTSEERDRLTVALTHQFEFEDSLSYVRLQYSHDQTDAGDDDSIFLQFGFNFGRADEVR